MPGYHLLSCLRASQRSGSALWALLPRRKSQWKLLVVRQPGLHSTWLQGAPGPADHFWWGCRTKQRLGLCQLRRARRIEHSEKEFTLEGSGAGCGVTDRPGWAVTYAAGEPAFRACQRL